MNSLHQPARVPLAVMAAMVVSLTACLDTPTAVDSADLWVVSEMGNGNGGGGGKPVGGGSGNSLNVGFSGSISLFSGATSDYTGDPQAVSGSNGKNSLQVMQSGYTLTINLADELAEKVAAGKCTDPEFAALGLFDPEGVDLIGELEINVNKRTMKKSGETDTGDGTVTADNGIVVNLTVMMEDGREFFLTTGSSPGGSNAFNSAEDTFARVGGFLRVNVDGVVGPICQGIVDYEFTVS